MKRSMGSSAAAGFGNCRVLAAVGLAVVLAACEEPEPRSFTDFMDDRIAREGIIAQCNQDPVAARGNIECANARRAAAAIALRLERDRREALERESERKLAALRREMAERERLVREAAIAAARAEREAYEARWREAQEAGAVLSSPELAPTDPGPRR
jgi:hypothetical protein